MPPHSALPAELPAANAEVAIELVATALGRLQYGSILLTVRDGRIVNLDTTEKLRFPCSADSPRPTEREASPAERPAQTSFVRGH